MIDPNECILWEGNPNTKYPSIKLNGITLPIQRVVYIEHNGGIPDGYQVTASCGVRRCVNIDHLVASTMESRFLMQAHQGIYRRRNEKYCVNGHKRTFKNTYVRKTNGGIGETFVCKDCAKARAYEWEQRNRPPKRTLKQIREDKKNKTHCPKGHRLHRGNYRWTPDKRYNNSYFKRCLKCARDTTAKYRKDLKEYDLREANKESDRTSS